MLSRRKLLFVSAIKQIAAQWFRLTSKSSSQAVIVISKPEMYYLGCVLQSSERLCPPLQKGFSFSFCFFFFCWLFRFRPNRWLHYMSLKHPKLPLYILFVALKTLAHTLRPISYLTAVLETCRDNLMKQWWLWLLCRQVNERLPFPRGETSRGPLKWWRLLSQSLFIIIYMYYI